MRPRVVIVGAGFGGLAAARRLAGEPVEVTIVDRNNFHTFLPLLYQVATAGLNAADVSHAVRGVIRRHPNVEFRQFEVTGADWQARELVGVSQAGPDRLPFDQLIVATGSVAGFFGVPGAEEHSFPLYSLRDAARLRNHVLARFEAAASDPRLIDDGHLTFVIVGGGPTGVETAGALAELFDKVLRRDHKTLDVDRARVLLVERLDHLLDPFVERSRRHAAKALAARGVELRLGVSVAEITPDRVVFDDGEVEPCHTLVWAAGVRANPVAETLGLPLGLAGRVPVGSSLAVADRAGVWAIGDAAHIVSSGGALPQLAQVAIQSGEHAALQITNQLAGRPLTAFGYHDKGTMATIGRHAAVAELPGGRVLAGPVAWAAWLGLHLVYLIGFRNRASVLVNWAWNYFTWDRGPRLIFSLRRPIPTGEQSTGEQSTGERDDNG